MGANAPTDVPAISSAMPRGGGAPPFDFGDFISMIGNQGKPGGGGTPTTTDTPTPGRGPAGAAGLGGMPTIPGNLNPPPIGDMGLGSKAQPQPFDFRGMLPALAVPGVPFPVAQNSKGPTGGGGGFPGGGGGNPGGAPVRRR